MSACIQLSWLRLTLARSQLDCSRLDTAASKLDSQLSLFEVAKLERGELSRLGSAERSLQFCASMASHLNSFPFCRSPPLA